MFSRVSSSVFTLILPSTCHASLGFFPGFPLLSTCGQNGIEVHILPTVVHPLYAIPVSIVRDVGLLMIYLLVLIDDPTTIPANLPTVRIIPQLPSATITGDHC